MNVYFTFAFAKQGEISVEWIKGDRTGLIYTYSGHTWRLADADEQSHLFAHMTLVDGATLETSPLLFVYEQISVQGVFNGK